ncbi:atrial natriuretic peptide receptor 1 [Striga asiatica]|uniref:Atrial natriuretic peptide receptor 1 n=1 Tax=Striga asiatica TaxID=4170 RepID=A0A5A7NZU7_STRAF|nr:atrial natriuretic peptide receptor 1 [Striga asiatica]
MGGENPLKIPNKGPNGGEPKWNEPNEDAAVTVLLNGRMLQCPFAIVKMLTFSAAQMEKELACEVAHTDICCCQPGFQLLPSIPDLKSHYPSDPLGWVQLVEVS